MNMERVRDVRRSNIGKNLLLFFEFGVEIV
jgi:hypothetical protein